MNRTKSRRYRYLNGVTPLSLWMNWVSTAAPKQTPCWARAMHDGVPPFKQ